MKPKPFLLHWHLVALVIMAFTGRAATVNWTGGSGDWSDTNHWSGNALPGVNDDVVITSFTNVFTVTHSSGAHTVKSIRSTQAFTVSGGTLVVTGTFTNSANIALTGGSIGGGTVKLVSPATLIPDSNSNNRLSNVTLNGDVTLSQECVLRIGGLLTLNGTITLGGLNAKLVFDAGGPQLLGGVGAVVFAFGQSDSYLTTESTTQLTIGSGITIRGQRGAMGAAFFNGGNHSIDNQGTILADVADPSSAGLQIVQATFTNHGVVEARNSGMLTVENLTENAGTARVESGASLKFGGSWKNTGSITINNGSFFQTGTVNTADLGIINRVGGNFILVGTVNNAGSILTLDATRGSWTLDGGRIAGGTVNVIAPTTLNPSLNSNSHLSDVTLNGDVNVSQECVLRIGGSLILNGTITLGGVNAKLTFDAGGPQLLGGVGAVVFGSGQSDSYLTTESTTQLTIGSGITIRGQRGAIGASFFNGGNHSIDNQGTISADVPDPSSGGLQIVQATFTNHGVLSAQNGDRFVATGVVEGPNAGLVSDSISTIQFNGNIVSTATTASKFTPKGQTALSGGTSGSPVLLEVMSRDNGSLQAALLGADFAYGTLTIGANSYVKLVDNARNSGSPQPEVLYVNTLVVPAGSTLDLNHLAVYAGSSQISGSVINGSVIQVMAGQEISVGGTYDSQLFASDTWEFFARAGTRISVETKSAGLLHVFMRNAAGENIASGVTGVANEPLIFTPLITADGFYHLNVNASGETYRITVTELGAPTMWPGFQRDGQNTGRAKFSVPGNRIGPNFFSTIKWQTPSPTDVDATGRGQMVYFDGANPFGTDIVVGTHFHLSGVQGMDRHTGKTVWVGNNDGPISGSATPTFSLDGRTLYSSGPDIIPRTITAFDVLNGPSMFWTNSPLPDPSWFIDVTEKVGPDGRIYSVFDSHIAAAEDTGTNLFRVMDAPGDGCTSRKFAFTTIEGSPAIIGAGGYNCGFVQAYDAATGTNIWAVDVGYSTEATPTVDPNNGNIYLPVEVYGANGDMFVAGLKSDGSPLWGTYVKRVFTFVPGVTNPQYLNTAGCLSDDGSTYYFQSNSRQADGSLYAINTADGSVKWTVMTGSYNWNEPSSSPIVTTDGVIIVGNNRGGEYWAIRDVGAGGSHFATLAMEDGRWADSSAMISDDGVLYLTARLKWTKGNGNGDMPNNRSMNLYTAFDLTPKVATISLGDVYSISDSYVAVPVTLDAVGQENSLTFNLKYDTALVSVPSLRKNDNIAGLSVTLASALGVTTVRMNMPAGQTFGHGAIDLGTFYFAPQKTSFSTTVSFADQPVPPSTISDGGATITSQYLPAQITVTPPLTSPQHAWPMRQKDGWNTGRADFSVPVDRLGTNFFRAIKWQKLAAEGDAYAFNSATLPFYDGAGPGGTDLLVGAYGGVIGIQGMDRRTGKMLWIGSNAFHVGHPESTPAFSPDGSTIYTPCPDPIVHPFVAFNSVVGAANFWTAPHADDGLWLLQVSPKAAPDGRIFAGHEEHRLVALNDTSTNLSIVWNAEKLECRGFKWAFSKLNGRFVTIGSGGYACGMVRAYDGLTGLALWQTEVGYNCESEPTVDPVNGNIYIPMAGKFSDEGVVIIGLSRDGLPIWNSVAMRVLPPNPTAQETAPSAGCLSHDGKTYYFQTISQQGTGKLFAINTVDGSVKWACATGSKGWAGPSSSPIVTSNGVIVVGNNEGGAYYAVRDDGSHATILAALPMDNGLARSSATASEDGLLYLPTRMKWDFGNGDGEVPTHATANVFTAFDLNSAPQILSTSSLAIGDVSTASNSEIDVPVIFTSDGNANSIAFSVSFDVASLTFLGFRSATIPGLTLVGDSSLAAEGFFGMTMSVNVGGALPRGNLHIGDLRLRAIPQNVSAQLQFSDSPVPRRITDAEGVPIPAAYSAGSANASPRALEAVDTAGFFDPGIAGSGIIVQKIRAVNSGVEHKWTFSLHFDPTHVQFIDALPTAATTGALIDVNTGQILLGNVAITVELPPNQVIAAGVTDFVAVRYQAVAQNKTSAVQITGTPTAITIFDLGGRTLPRTTVAGQITTGGRVLQVMSVSGQVGQFIDVPVLLVSAGDEKSVSFTFNFSPSSFDFILGLPGSAIANGSLTMNAAAPGGAEFTASAKPGTTLPAGVSEVFIARLFAKAADVANLTVSQINVTTGAGVELPAGGQDGITTITGSDSPVIVAQPRDTSALLGTAAQFKVTVAGQGPFTYQWRKGGQEIQGATLSTFDIASVAVKDEGAYSVLVKNNFGAVVSLDAHLVALRPPAITVQPIGTNVVAGQGFSLAVTASGPGPLTYQWSVNGDEIHGETGSTLQIASAGPGDIGDYTVSVGNSVANVTSIPARVNVISIPSLNSAPTGGSRPIGGNILFTVDATGTPPLRYQWKLNGQNIPGATSSTYGIPTIGLDDAGLYTVTIANDISSITTDPVELLLDIEQAPAQDNFVNATALTGSEFQFSGSNANATAEAGEHLHADRKPNHSVWFKWSSPTAGRLNLQTLGSSFDTVLAVYTGTRVDALTPIASNDDAGPNLTSIVEFNVQPNVTYYIALDGFASQVGQFTGNYIITGLFTPSANLLPEFVLQPRSETKTSGSELTLSVGLRDTSVTYTYQWFLNGRALQSETGATLHRVAISEADLGNYHVVVTNPIGLPARSATAVIEIGVQTEVRSVDKPEDTLVALPASLKTKGVVSHLEGSSALQVSFGAVVPQTYNLYGESEQFAGSRCPVIGGMTRYLPIVAQNAGTLVVLASSTVDCNLTLRDGNAPLHVYTESCAGRQHRLELEVQVGMQLYLESDSATEGILSSSVYIGKAPTPPAPNASLVQMEIGAGEATDLTAPASLGVPAPAYQWYLDGGLITDATAATYHASAPGLYSVVESNAIGSQRYDVARLATLRPMQMTLTVGRPALTLTLSGNSGQSYRLASTTDFQNWNVESSGWLTGDTSLLPLTPNAPLTFYHFREIGLTEGLNVNVLARGYDVSVLGGHTGKKYVIERQDGAGPWVPIATNIVTGATQHILDTTPGGGAAPHYRATGAN